MRVAINHETVYRYQKPANYSIQYLRLSPISGPTQRVLSWKLKGPGSLRPWTDGFGNAAHVLVVDEPHQEIRITAVGEVEIADVGKALLGESEPHPPELFLRSTLLTEADDRVRRFAGGFKPAVIGNVRKGLDALVSGIRQTVDFRPGASQTTTTTAGEALEKRVGVYQDHAHIFVACCRSLGVPSRYVSGYLCSDTASDSQMSAHAWAESWVDGAGWLSYDVGNRMSNAKANVRVAVGLDYLDAAPVRGIRQGAANEDMEVEVTIADARLIKQRQQQAQQ